MRYGIIDTTGDPVVPCEYSKGEYAYGHGYIFLLKDNYLTIIPYAD